MWPREVPRTSIVKSRRLLQLEARPKLGGFVATVARSSESSGPVDPAAMPPALALIAATSCRNSCEDHMRGRQLSFSSGRHISVSSLVTNRAFAKDMSIPLLETARFEAR